MNFFLVSGQGKFKDEVSSGSTASSSGKRKAHKHIPMLLPYFGLVKNLIAVECSVSRGYSSITVPKPGAVLINCLGIALPVLAHQSLYISSVTSFSFLPSFSPSLFVFLST